MELGKIILPSPEVEIEKPVQIHSGRLVPIYVESEGISSRWFRDKIFPVLKNSTDLFTENLPSTILQKFELMDYAEAIQQIHFPDSPSQLEKAKKRLAFQEILLLQIKSLQRRLAWQKIHPSEQKIIAQNPLVDQFIKDLPFELTNAQTKVLAEIFSDLEKGFPMFRLVQGDVGSGKTIVAGIAALTAITQGYQTTLMAPTEILAEQHHQNLSRLFQKFNFNIKFLSSKVKTSEKNTIKEEIATGKVNLVIGTHAIIQENVNFQNLGLAIVDEQHRFGVLQREQLKKQQSPHLLSLSATPIPRTMAMTIYGDHDLSIIDELPKGRLPIITRIVPENKRRDAYLWIEDRIRAGRQAFIICPLIEESDSLELKSVISEYEHLQQNIFPHLKLAFLHGKMSSVEKEGIMNDFKQNLIQILVSTSVIEVGIDIPNASIMVIEGAERFGLSQLHQFRGRVGRGEHQSYCFLFMQQYSQTGMQRLKALVEHHSGFKLAEIDLLQRGSGQIYGVRQSGLGDLKLADLSDQKLISDARSTAEFILERDPEMALLPELKTQVEKLPDYTLNS